MNEFTLPNGLVINGVTFNKAYLQEITGKQQNYLANTKYTSPVDHIEHLLVDLLVDLRDSNSQSVSAHVTMRHAILHLLSVQDIQFLLVKLREITFGEKYFFDQLECPHCKVKNSAQLNLATLEIKPAKATQAALVLPRSKKPIEYKAMTLNELKKASSNTEHLMNNHITETISILLSKLGDASPVSASDVESLPALDTQYITENAPSPAYIDTNVTHACRACNQDFDFELQEMSVDFFALSRT